MTVPVTSGCGQFDGFSDHHSLARRTSRRRFVQIDAPGGELKRLVNKLDFEQERCTSKAERSELRLWPPAILLIHRMDASQCRTRKRRVVRPNVFLCNQFDQGKSPQAPADRFFHRLEAMVDDDRKHAGLEPLTGARGFRSYLAVRSASRLLRPGRTRLFQPHRLLGTHSLRSIVVSDDPCKRL
jgi:hypothetical protein